MYAFHGWKKENSPEQQAGLSLRTKTDIKPAQETAPRKKQKAEAFSIGIHEIFLPKRQNHETKRQTRVQVLRSVSFSIPFPQLPVS